MNRLVRALPTETLLESALCIIREMKNNNGLRVHPQITKPLLELLNGATEKTTGWIQVSTTHKDSFGPKESLWVVETCIQPGVFSVPPSKSSRSGYVVCGWTLMKMKTISKHWSFVPDERFTLGGQPWQTHRFYYIISWVGEPKVV